MADLRSLVSLSRRDVLPKEMDKRRYFWLFGSQTPAKVSRLMFVHFDRARASLLLKSPLNSLFFLLKNHKIKNLVNEVTPKPH